jgi:hypothetical protein
MANAKKMDVPDIGGLLGQIAEKRHDLPKAPIQSVQPVEEPGKVSPSAVKLAKQENAKTQEPLAPVRGVGGRPSSKKQGVEYVKLSPRIPKTLKKQAELALIQERFRDDDGQVIKTLDELITLAVERLFR